MTMKRINLFLLSLCAVYLFTPFFAGAVRLAPGQTAPLQLAPENEVPNYSGSIQNGAGADANSQQANPPASTYTGPTATGTNAEDTSAGQDLTALPQSSTAYTWYLMALVVIISAGIAGLYYWYKTRKE